MSGSLLSLERSFDREEQKTGRQRHAQRQRQGDQFSYSSRSLPRQEIKRRGREASLAEDNLGALSTTSGKS